MEQEVNPGPARSCERKSRHTRSVGDEVAEERLGRAGVTPSLTETHRSDTFAGGEARAEAGSHRPTTEPSRAKAPSLLRGRVERGAGVQPDARGKVGRSRRRLSPDRRLGRREEAASEQTEGRERGGREAGRVVEVATSRGSLARQSSR